MFRKMRRFKQEISQEKCKEILEKEPRGVLSVMGEEGYPYGFPMNYIYDENENKIYFHCAKEGHKIDSLRSNNKASFCIYDQGYREEGQWPLHINSVIVFGTVNIVTESKSILQHVRNIGLKYYPTVESVDEEIKIDGNHVQILEMTIDHMSGKLVKEA